MQTICENDMCAGCMACAEACPTKAISILRNAKAYAVEINQQECIDCERCVRVCQQLHPATVRMPTAWYQGWANAYEERRSSSSGGLASAIARAFVEFGGVVCSCTFENGIFGFALARTPDEIDQFKGSKYVKSNPYGVYRQVEKLLESNTKVLFIGLPCQVSAMRNIVGQSLEINLYTIDLICHGTPDSSVLENFLVQKQLTLKGLADVSFRKKARFQLREGEKNIDVEGVTDCYMTSFLEGLTYTENCYHCYYAQYARVSDITLGDSWGSELTQEMPDGISLILVQTGKGAELLRSIDATLCSVDQGRAISNNEQLRRPHARPKSHDKFLFCMQKGMPFNKNIHRCLPKSCFKQDVKRILVKIRLWTPSGGGYEVSYFMDDGSI